MRDERIEALVRELQAWPGQPVNSHKSAGQLFHKLVFVAESGACAEDAGMPPVVEKIVGSMDAEGIPLFPMEIGAARGGTGQRTGAWALCDAPSVLYALGRLGVRDERVDRGTRFLAALPRPSGYGCSVSESLGDWRGPGKKADPCPYATLVMLKLLLLYRGEFQAEKAACAECLLDLWEHSRERHPYIFYMGTDFRKLKLPFVWYDILHVAEVLSRVPGLGADPRFRSMLKVIQAKRGSEGFVPESVYQAWKDWDFGQKKLVSPTMGAYVKAIERRLGEGG